jgi:hypothetical protein
MRAGGSFPPRGSAPPDGPSGKPKLLGCPMIKPKLLGCSMSKRDKDVPTEVCSSAHEGGRTQYRAAQRVS